MTGEKEIQQKWGLEYLGQITLKIVSADCINKRTYRVFCECDGYKLKRLYNEGYPPVWCLDEQIINNKQINGLLEEAFNRATEESVIVYTPIFLNI